MNNYHAATSRPAKVEPPQPHLRNFQACNTVCFNTGPATGPSKLLNPQAAQQQTKPGLLYPPPPKTPPTPIAFSSSKAPIPKTLSSTPSAQTFGQRPQEIKFLTTQQRALKSPSQVRPLHSDLDSGSIRAWSLEGIRGCYRVTERVLVYGP